MKYLGMALAAAGLLFQATGAFAISFTPPRSLAVPADEVTTQQWTVGLSASSWNLPDSPGLNFESKVRPLLTAEYQATDKIAVGAWYNPIAWDATATGFGTASVDGSLFELHGTYALPNGYAAQLGYQEFDLDLKFAGANLGTVSANYATLWGLKTLELSKTDNGSFGLLLGLGIQQGINKRSGAMAGNGLIGASYAFSPRLSADASAWFNDFTRSDSSVTRFTAGVTGRF